MFYSHTHTISQSNKFFHLAYRSLIWKDLKHLWLKTRGFTPRCAFWGIVDDKLLIQKTSEVLSLLRPIVHDTSKTAKITWFILVLHWAVDVIEVLYYICGPVEY